MASSPKKVVVVDKLPQFKRNLYSVMEDAIREAARDTFIDAKSHAPFQKGALRNQADFRQSGRLKQTVSFWVEYAAYQEAGRRANGGHRVRRYTTAGTGAHFLKNAGDKQSKKLAFTLRKHAWRARV